MKERFSRRALQFTLPELLRLSTFVLPAVSASDPEGWRELRRGRVPGATREQVRRFESLGLFDRPKAFVVPRADVFPIVTWERVQRVSGVPRLYDLLDVATLRLAMWMRRDEHGPKLIASVLRGKWAGRAVLSGTAAEDRSAEFVLSGDLGAVLHYGTVLEYDRRAHALGVPLVSASAFRYPLAWLGVSGAGLTQLRRESSEFVTVFNRAVPRASVVEHQRPVAVATEVRPGGLSRL